MEVIHYTVKVNPAAEGGYWAEVPALPGCFTQGETLEEVTAFARQAIESHLTNLMRIGASFPIEKRLKRAFTFPVMVRTTGVSDFPLTQRNS